MSRRRDDAGMTDMEFYAEYGVDRRIAEELRAEARDRARAAKSMPNRLPKGVPTKELIDRLAPRMSPEIMNTAQALLQRLAATECVGSPDGLGFGRHDKDIGTDLAHRQRLSPRQAALAAIIAYRHRAQLAILTGGDAAQVRDLVAWVDQWATVDPPSQKTAQKTPTTTEHSVQQVVTPSGISSGLAMRQPPPEIELPPDLQQLVDQAIARQQKRVQPSYRRRPTGRDGPER